VRAISWSNNCYVKGELGNKGVGLFSGVILLIRGLRVDLCLLMAKILPFLQFQ